ncbi:hypothetical protein ACFQWC_14210 [Rossellomorea sp. GCM10028870]|uniref:hypothetical protein n=1 Tax=Rossellomorea sp. GCM10028870 TaxID=3273426 RepID=UPI00361C7BB0
MMRGKFAMLLVPGDGADPDISVTVKQDGLNEYEAESNFDVIIQDKDPILAAFTAYVYSKEKSKPNGSD